MKRLVYAEDVIANIDEWLDTVGYPTIGQGLTRYAELLGCICDAPTAEVKRFGKWIEVINEYECSECGASYPMFGEYDVLSNFYYCPYCGAEMSVDGD